MVVDIVVVVSIVILKVHVVHIIDLRSWYCLLLLYRRQRLIKVKYRWRRGSLFGQNLFDRRASHINSCCICAKWDSRRIKLNRVCLLVYLLGDLRMVWYLLLLSRLRLSFKTLGQNNIRRRRNELVCKLRIVSSNLFFLLFLDFLAVDLNVGICHSILLLRKKIINLRSSAHSPSSNSYSWSTDCVASSSRDNLTLRVFKLRNIHGIFFSSELL